MLSYGSTGTDVKELQMNLITLGLNPGPADGVFGPKTQAAVEEFQRLHGLAVTGVFGWQTEQKMYEVFNTPAPLITPLSGRTFIVEAGHGGSDPGAVDGTDDDQLYTEEKTLILPYAREFADTLEELGATVIRIRFADVDLELWDRTDIANKYPNADALISWHANSATNPAAFGEESLVYSTGSPAEKLAEALRDEFQQAGVPLHGAGIVERPGLWMLRKTTMPALIEEIGFISNPDEEARLNDPDYRRAVVGSAVNAVVRVYGKTT